MRGLRLAVLVVLCGGLAEMSILACHNNSASDDDQDAGDSGDDGDAFSGFDVTGGSIGEDAGGGFESGYIDSGGEDCSMPNGTYVIQATATGDASANCPPWASTIHFPPSEEVDGAAACLGGPGTGTYMSDGFLPVCSLDFTCSSDNGEQNTQTSGSIEVFEGSYAGTTESLVYSDFDGGGQPLYTCYYHLDYTQSQ